MDCIIKEATEIQLHPNHINRDGGYILSWAWQPALCQIQAPQGLRPQQTLRAHPFILNGRWTALSWSNISCSASI
jgi:ribonuclease I